MRAGWDVGDVIAVAEAMALVFVRLARDVVVAAGIGGGARMWPPLLAGSSVAEILAGLGPRVRDSLSEGGYLDVANMIDDPLGAWYAGFAAQIATRRFGSAKGSGRKRTPLTTVKIAVVAPMPSARVMRATTVKAGDPARTRTA